MPKGGGAIRGLGEKLSTNPATGTASLGVPISTPGARGSFDLNLGLGYDSSSGNSPFGLGWQMSVPMITRKTEKGLPQYLDEDESDVFVLSGAEDLVPTRSNGALDVTERDGHRVLRYRPRVEGLFAQIERWTDVSSGVIHWRAITRDNVTSIYGASAQARVADPAVPDRVFSWLLEETRDDRGNIARYSYQQEDGAGVDRSQSFEAARFDGAGHFTATAQRYLKRIEYGNRRPSEPSDWLFEIVLDYGEHDAENPDPDGTKPWSLRPDPFSSFRPGFEIRTYRLCERILVFHRFAELGADACLVRSIDLAYDRSDSLTYLVGIEHRGYRRDGSSYVQRATPALTLDYRRAVIHDEVHLVAATSADATALWVDLDGEGIAGALVAEPGGWYYQANLGDGTLAPSHRLPVVPAGSAPGGDLQLLDLGGDGQLDLVRTGAPTPGYFEHLDDGSWDTFRAFRSLPPNSWSDPDLRMVDLDGDGFPDILVMLHDGLVWYPSLAKDGFAPPITLHKPFNEQDGPAVVFTNESEAVHLADMSGDGLVDIVRIRNGEVCYWPNLGYGRFGAKITVDNAPWFDVTDQFDPRRVRLYDIDGSGTADVIYFGRAGATIYRNCAGNRLTDPTTITSLPTLDTLSNTTIVDFLGTGTACLVWSSPAPGNTERPLAYVDLMGGTKPHLLTSLANNLGAETVVTYAPSTRFYLADKIAGRPWITRLAFPVHVVERLETRDRISRNRFVTRFAYHHGYFDPVEREFAGFAMAEQWDTEELGVLTADGDMPFAANIDAASYVPPVLKRTWFHTGGLLDGRAISQQLAHEYWSPTPLLPDTVLDPMWTADEQREAVRALRGAKLREEVFALDGSVLESRPYSIAETNHSLYRLQGHDGGRHAIFFRHAREALTLNLERSDEPRIEHTATLDVDAFNNVLASATAAYGRKQPDATLRPEHQAEQARLQVTYTENRFTNAVDLADSYRTPMPAESVTYEITGVEPADALFTFDELLERLPAATFIDLEQTPGSGPHKRRVAHSRTLYRSDDLTAQLPLYTVESLAVPYQTLQLVMTPGLVSSVYGTDVTAAMLGEAGYTNVDSAWWRTTGRIFYAPDPNDNELALARQHFFLPRRYEDAFGNRTTITWDPYDLLTIEFRDPEDNVTTAGVRDGSGNLVENGLDYRVLQPRLVMDPNRNRIAAAYDALGLLVGMARMGKPEETKGDSLDGFVADLPDATVIAHLQDPLSNPGEVLGRATTRVLYDRFAYQRSQQPAATCVVVRETHDADGPTTRFQHVITYADGFAREIQTKKSAPLAQWIGSGWTIFNNKGNAVRVYEPFLSATPAFELARIEGVSSTKMYDPLERVIAILHPDHSYEKTVFDPWRRTTWDGNDTVLLDPLADPDVGAWFARWPASDVHPTWYAAHQAGSVEQQDAAAKASIHAGTFTRGHVDSLGRPFLSVESNRARAQDGTIVEETYRTRIALDISADVVEVFDPLDRSVARFQYDAAGRRIQLRTMDAGERRVLPDLSGIDIYAWDSRGHRFRSELDRARRRTKTFVTGAIESDPTREILYEQIEYGEGQPNDVALNLRAAVFRRRDGAGVVTYVDTDPATGEPVAYDFKGNSLRSRRELATQYKQSLDWTGPQPLEAESYTFATRYDALDRPVANTLPDRSIVRPTYDECGRLYSIDALLRGSQTAKQLVDSITYNARGQRLTTSLHNGATTQIDYDPVTFRAMRIHTTVAGNADSYQDLAYFYDPAGNITRVRDDAQHTIYFRNRRVEPTQDFTYDATYRLIAASGRELLGLVNGSPAAPAPTSPNDLPRTGAAHPNDGNALGRYIEQYLYDAVGNLTQMLHAGTDPASPGWTRTYHYREPSQLEPGTQVANRLSATQLGSGPEQPYTYDAHGNMTTMPHLSMMRWDCSDRLAATSKQVVNSGTPESTYYVYDGRGRRIRKVTERATPTGGNATRTSERLYLGGLEIYRSYGGDGTTIDLERQSVHAFDGAKRIATIEVRTQGDDGSPQQVDRYRFDNHVGSTCLELDGNAEVITYEEYYPFGSTSYQGVRDKQTPNRYRFIGRERDDETGLGYHGARYYAGWLGRWTAPDPAGLVDGTNLYAYCGNDPIGKVDRSGTDGFKVNVRLIDAKDLPQDKLNKNVVVPPASLEPYNPDVEIHDYDNNNTTISKLSEVRSSPNYVDNSLATVSAPKGDIWTLDLNELHFTYKSGRTLDVPWSSIDLGAHAVTTHYARLDGVIYPIGSDGHIAFNDANTPAIVYGAQLKWNDARKASETRVEYSELVNTFAALIGANAEGASAANHFSESSEVTRPQLKSSVEEEEEIVEEPQVNGNSKKSTKAQHVYEITRTDNATGVTETEKFGISGGKETQSGESYRANRQVNALNRQAGGAATYRGRVVARVPAGPGARQTALDIERQLVYDHLATTGAKPPGNIRP